MQIDYFTIAAQIINFLVLVFLLRHFLYQPVIKSMKERELRISNQLKEAEDKGREAEQKLESYSKMEREISDKRQELLAKAAEESEANRADLMKKARSEVEAARVGWSESLRQQEEALLADLSLRAGEEVYAVARRVLQDLADEDLERRAIDAFIKRLQNLNQSEKESVKEFYKTPSERITIRSTFEIQEEQRQRIRELLRDQTGFEPRLEFEIAPQLICGVEMDASDLRIGWSIAGYLDALRGDLSRSMEQQVAEKAQPGGGDALGKGRA